MTHCVCIAAINNEPLEGQRPRLQPQKGKRSRSLAEGDRFEVISHRPKARDESI